MEPFLQHLGRRSEPYVLQIAGRYPEGLRRSKQKFVEKPSGYATNAGCSTCSTDIQQQRDCPLPTVPKQPMDQQHPWIPEEDQPQHKISQLRQLT